MHTMQQTAMRLLAVAALAACAWGQAAPDAPRPTEGYLPQFSRTVKPAERERVRLAADFPADLGVAAWPVTFGVPFPRGAVRAAENLRVVTAEGVEVPSQIERTATWHGPDGDVKWALVDMTAERGKSYLVEYGRQVRPAATPGIRVATDDDRIVVDTGRIRASFSRTRSHLMEAVWLDGDGDGRYADSEQVLHSRTRMFMVDQTGARFETSDSPDDYKVEAETAGPRRVTIKATGRYRDAAGGEVCHYVTRVELFAGQPFARVFHTFILARDSDKTQFRDIGLPFDLAAGPAREAACPSGLGPAAAVRSGPPPLRVIQDRVDRFTVQDGSGKPLLEGQRAGAWISAAAQAGGIAVGLRHVWQEYPRELEATADGVIAHLWPLHTDRLLDFRAEGQLGPELYADYNSREYYLDFYKGGLGEYDQAFGLARTNELVVAFFAQDPAAACAACEAVDRPPFLTPEPEWMCRSDAFGPLNPRDKVRFPEVESKLDIAFGRYEFLREHIGHYGFFDYGDVSHQVSFDAKKKRWVDLPWRRFASRFYGISLMPWMQFARTGDRRFREWAIDNARHVMDIDMCHLTNTSSDIGRFPRYKGSRYGGNGGIIHYGHGAYVIGCDSHVAPWAYCYYMTGYRRAWDVLLEEGDYYFDRKAHFDFTRRYDGRHTGGAMLVMITLWNATWDPRYLDAARKLADLCYVEAAKGERGVIRRDDVYMNPGAVEYYQATGDERMKKLFLQNMWDLNDARPPEDDDRAFTYYGPAMAYHFTGDPAYLRRSAYWLRQYLECLNVGDDPLYRGVPDGHWDFCYNNIHLLYTPYYLTAAASLAAPVPEAADQSACSHEMWLNNPDGKALPLTVRWFVNPPAGAWDEYLKLNKPKGRVVLLDPADAVVAEAGIDLLKDGCENVVTLNGPAGKPGMYRVAAEGLESYRLRLSLLTESVRQWVYPLDTGFVCHGDSYWFQAPADREEFTVRFKVFATTVTPKVRLLDPSDAVVKEMTSEFKTDWQVPWTEWKVAAPAESRGKLWRLQVRPLHPKVLEVRLRVDGPPPVASVSREAFFVPDPLPKTRTPTPAALPPGVTTRARAIPAGKEFVVDLGKKLDDGRYERIHAAQGTIEFWMRPGWDPDDTTFYDSMPRVHENADFLRCGDMLGRRTHFGARNALRGGVLATNMILRPGAWYHIAFAWDLAAKERPRLFSFHVNGAHLGVLHSQPPKPGEDWTGPIRIRALTGETLITGLRVSSVSRYDDLVKGVLSPPPDDRTLYHDQP